MKTVNYENGELRNKRFQTNRRGGKTVGTGRKMASRRFDVAEAEIDQTDEHQYFEGRAYGRPTPTTDEELVRVGPGTKGGELLRRYWQPFALADEATSKPQHVSVLDECLVLYRDGDGNPGLLYPRCMHRGTDLIYGKVEQTGIRCCYHGWVFDSQGHCLEIPTETNEKLRQRIRQPWYPVMEKFGLLFTYMGPPELQPGFPTFSLEDDLGESERIVSYRSDSGPNGPHPKLSAASDYNWWQMYDNWMDPFHVCVLHYSINGPQFSPSLGILPEVDFRETADGVISIQKRVRAEGPVQQRISQVIMPNMNCTAGVTDEELGVAGIGWTVPIDDTSYVMFGLVRIDRENPVSPPDIPMLQDHWGPDHGKPFAEWTLEDHQQWQTDYVAQKGQGDITSHSEEHLMAGDKGTALSRRFFRRQAELVASGQQPIGATPNVSYRVEILGGNALLDRETGECVAGYAATT
ncbi:MAG: Rieske 2Fe-2S domain-containing protein [Pseudomonadales bacterium]|nr:Rieske 2Fe-2S domain-containing protein [Pseudomonadales bacterium]